MPVATDLRIEAENRPGQLAGIGEALGKVGVNIEGFCAVAGDDRGYLHVLVDQGQAARQALADAGFSVTAERTAIVLPGVEDRPGYLGDVAGKLAAANVNIEASYLATNTRLVFAVDDPDAARAAL